MTAELDKMLAGALYDPADPTLVAGRRRARALCQQINALPADDDAARRPLLAQLFGAEVDAFVTPPFNCDYGLHIELGAGVYFNFGCVVLDVCRVRIGARTLFGPGVHVYAATHPMLPEDRATGLELGKPVVIGADVWVGGGTLVCPGVVVGDGAVIGAGSVVTRDVPARTFAAGNPCRVIRAL